MQLSDKEKLQVINWLATQELGLKFLRWLAHEVCNYNVTSIGYENGAASANATMFNEARKDIWRTVRSYLFHSNLIKIESHDMLLQQEKLEEIQKLTAQEGEENE